MSEMIDVKELMKKMTTEVIKSSAESYFSSIKNPAYHLSKPFASLDECPVLLISFSRILQNGRFTPGQRVLEFGAGSCWAGRLLNQLGLEVISVDISASALKLGQRLKAEWPVFGAQPLHSFLETDGLTIDLPDGSVDRIVCLDCFHHVSNQDQILREFYRILKPSGLIAFSEPGADHSKTPQSQFEMKNYGVIENDILLDEIWGLSESIGFKRMYCAFNLLQAPTLDLSAYRIFQQGGLSNDTLQSLGQCIQDEQVNASLFFIEKDGYDIVDSRTRIGMGGALRLISSEEINLLSGDRGLKVSLEVTNTSGQIWLKSDSGIGAVNIGIHLFDGQGRMLELDYYRYHFLFQNSMPGQVQITEFTVPIPKQAGQFTFEIDLVSEGVSWFAVIGSQAIKIDYNAG